MRLQQKASLLFLITVALYLAAAVIIGVLPLSGDKNLFYLLNAFLVSIPAFLVPALLFRRRNSLPSFSVPKLTHVLIAAGIGLGCVFVNEALALLNSAIFSGVDINSNGTTSQSILGVEPWIMVLTLAVIPPVAEEFLMRGSVLESWRRSSPVAAAILTSAFFALMHLSPSGFMIYFGIGMLLAGVYLLTRNVWLTVTVHFVNNISSVISALYLSGSLQKPDAYTEAVLSSPLMSLEMSLYAAGFAAMLIVPLALLLRKRCIRDGVGCYAPQAEPSGTEAENVEPEAVKRARYSLFRDPFIIISAALLAALNVLSGLIEFGVIKR